MPITLTSKVAETIGNGVALSQAASGAFRTIAFVMGCLMSGLTGYIALCLLSGYAWLAAAGLLGLLGGFQPGHLWRDATLHAVTLGFVFAMIFGHAPIIFPAVLRVKIPWHPLAFLPLALLHASLAWRVVGGLGERYGQVSAGGMANAIALLVFILVMLSSVLRGQRGGSGEA